MVKAASKIEKTQMILFIIPLTLEAMSDRHAESNQYKRKQTLIKESSKEVKAGDKEI